MLKLKNDNEYLKKARQPEDKQRGFLTVEEQLDCFADIIIEIFLENEYENEDPTKQSQREA
jgi:hypothetical protein